MDQKNDEQWSYDGHQCQFGCNVSYIFEGLEQKQQLSFSPFQATILSTNGHSTDNHHLLIHFTSSQWIKRMMNSIPMMVIKASFGCDVS
jgi:hypothetical protein